MVEEKKDWLKVQILRYYNGYIVKVGEWVVTRQWCIRVFVTKKQAEVYHDAVIKELVARSNQIKDEEKAKWKGWAKKTKARTKKSEQAESEEGVDHDAIK